MVWLNTWQYVAITFWKACSYPSVHRASPACWSVLNHVWQWNNLKCQTCSLVLGSKTVFVVFYAFHSVDNCSVFFVDSLLKDYELRPKYNKLLVCSPANFNHISSTVWVKKIPLRFTDIFPKWLGIFSPNFMCLLYVPVLIRLLIRHYNCYL